VVALLKCISIAGICAGLALPQAPGRTKRKVADEEVRRVHAATILIDTHNDVTSLTVEGTDIGKPSKNHTDIPRMKQGGMGAQFFAIFVAGNYVDGNHAAKRAMDMIDTVKTDIVARYPNDFMFATTAADIGKRTGNIRSPR
jgi:membrane dipeptidase